MAGKEYLISVLLFREHRAPAWPLIYRQLKLEGGASLLAIRTLF